jgi:hypothetical protein
MSAVGEFGVTPVVAAEEPAGSDAEVAAEAGLAGEVDDPVAGLGDMDVVDVDVPAAGADADPAAVPDAGAALVDAAFGGAEFADGEVAVPAVAPADRSNAFRCVRNSTSLPRIAGSSCAAPAGGEAAPAVAVPVLPVAPVVPAMLPVAPEVPAVALPVALVPEVPTAPLTPLDCAASPPSGPSSVARFASSLA